jgi:hypothetical protein
LSPLKFIAFADIAVKLKSLCSHTSYTICQRHTLARDANTISTFAFPGLVGVQMTGFAVHRASKYLLSSARRRHIKVRRGGALSLLRHSFTLRRQTEFFVKQVSSAFETGSNPIKSPSADYRLVRRGRSLLRGCRRTGSILASRDTHEIYFIRGDKRGYNF